jgi:hypothetical protein
MVVSRPERDEAPPEVVEISQALIGAVANKLEDGTASFSDDEKAVVQTVFALAAKGLGAFPGPVSCVGDLTIRIGEESISVERRAGSDVPKMSEAFADSFCPGKLSRYDIEGLEVDRSAVGTEMSSGAAVSAGAKSVAALAAGAKSVAAAAGAKSVAALAAGAKSVAAAAGAKSVAALAAGAKSVAAAAGAKSVAALAAGAKSVAAQATNSFLKSVPPSAVYLNPGYRIERCTHCRTARCIPAYAISLCRYFAIQRCG